MQAKGFGITFFPLAKAQRALSKDNGTLIFTDKGG